MANYYQDTDLQPFIQIRWKKSSSHTWTDITSYLYGRVSFKEEADSCHSLDAEFIRGDAFLEFFSIGDNIQFYGGTQAPENQSYFITGWIARINGIFPESGEPRVHVFVLDGLAVGGMRNYDIQVYPSPGNKYAWAQGSSISTSALATHIITDIIGATAVQVAVTKEHLWTTSKPAYQDKLTAWRFLCWLARQVNCTVYRRRDPSNPEAILLYFVDNDTYFSDNQTQNISGAGQLSFVYPGRTTAGLDLNAANLQYGTGKYNNKGEFLDLKETPMPNPIESSGTDVIILKSLEVDEDADAANSNVRTAIVLTKDADTGQPSWNTVTAEWDTAKQKYIYYTLDEEKVKELQDSNPKEANRLFSGGVFSDSWDKLKPYFKQNTYIERPVSDNQYPFDTPLIGINITARCRGDVRIASMQSYNIAGVAKYSGVSGRPRKWFLLNVEHYWDGEYLCEMSFKLIG